MKVRDILKESNILVEAFSPYALEKAMDDKKLISIYYDSPHDTTNDKGWRRIEPFVLGRNKHGNDVIRAWQVGGSSDTPEGKLDDPLSKMPGWRMFRLDGIKNINIGGGDTIDKIRPKYNPDDKDMSVIYKYLDFGDNGEITMITKGKPSTEPVTKEPETEPKDTPTPSVTKPEVDTDRDNSVPDISDRIKDKPKWLQNLVNRFNKIVNRKNG